MVISFSSLTFLPSWRYRVAYLRNRLCNIRTMSQHYHYHKQDCLRYISVIQFSVGALKLLCAMAVAVRYGACCARLLPIFTKEPFEDM